MSASGVSLAALQPGAAPVRRRVRAFFRPTQNGVWTGFDVATLTLETPLTLPAGWVDAGACAGFVRRSTTVVEALRSGSPASAANQVRTAVGAEVEVLFESWGKLQMALSSGSQQMNVLVKTGAGASVTEALAAGSTASVLQMSAAGAAQLAAGSVLAVDADYAGQTGVLGAGAAATYVSPTATAPSDVDFLRRMTLNVGVVASVQGGAVTLAAPLLGGAPAAGMQASQVLGFADREGGGFFQEWSGVFVVEGEQGDKVLFCYPRLQAMDGVAEKDEALGSGLTRMPLLARFRALAVADAEDGTAVVCYRTYLPAAMRLM